MLYITNESINKNLKEYVKNGGNLILTFRSGVKNWQNVMTTKTIPGDLRELIGGVICEYTVINRNERVRFLDDYSVYDVENFCERLIPEKAHVIAEYNSGPYNDDPAILVNDYHNGKVIYIGADLEKKALERIIFDLIPKAKYKVSAEIEISSRKKGNKKFTFIMNHSQNFEDVDGVYGRDLLTNENVTKKIYLEPFGVRIIEEINS